MGDRELVQSLVVTAEVLGHELSPLAAKAMARELSQHPAGDVAQALRRCQRELKGRLSLSDVLNRMPGFVGAEEAWALCPRGEDATVVWTDEIAQAYGIAAPLLEAGDQVGARMAFREAYAEAVAQARNEGKAQRWWPSLGHDAAQRATVLRAAVERGRLPAEYVAQLLPAGDSAVPSELAGALKAIGDGGRR